MSKTYPFDGPGPKMLKVQFSSDQSTFNDAILEDWVREQSRGMGDETMDLRLAHALRENLWVIEMSGTRQNAHVDTPREDSIRVEELEDESLIVYFTD